MSFLYHEESIKLVELYSLGGFNALLESKLATQANLIGYLEDTMNNAQTSANWREAIISKLLGFKHLTSLHGPDALNIDDEYIEIKSESTYHSATGKIVRLCGAGCFAHYDIPSDLLKIKNQLMICCGFHKGKIVYVVSFKINDTFEKELYNKIIKKSNRASLKFNCVNWKDQKGLKLLYLCNDMNILGLNSIDQIMSKHLVQTIKKLS